MTEMEPQRKTRGSNTCLFGCLGTAAVVFILAVAAVLWIASNPARFFGGIATHVARQAIQESELPADQKQRVLEQIGRIETAIAEDKLDQAAFRRLMDSFVGSRLPAAMALLAIQEGEIRPSGLSESEKADARRQLGRCARALHEKKLPWEALEEIFDPYMEKGIDGNKKMRDLNDADLRRLTADLKQRCDAMDMPDADFVIDVAAELKQVVDEALDVAADKNTVPDEPVTVPDDGGSPQ